MLSLRWLTRAMIAGGLVAALAVGMETGPSRVEALTAQTVPGTWTSGITVLNPSTNPAPTTIQVMFYDSSGNVISAATQTASNVAPGATAFWYVPNITGLPAGGTYSAVVSADQPVYATVNLTSTNPTTGETYNGVGSDGTSMAMAPTTYVPSVLKDYYGYTSTVVVQNTGSTAATLSLQLVGTSSKGSVNQTVTSPSAVAANASYTFDLANYASQLGTGFNGGATITGGGQNVAVISNTYTPSATPSLFSSTNAFASGSSTSYIPGLYKNYYGFTSALTVQNMDSTATNVTVTYATGATDTFNGLAPGSSHVFYTPNNASLPNGWQGSAKVTSGGQNILAQVNINAGGTSGVGLGSYGGFTGGTTKVFAPGLLKSYYGYNTALTIQNVDSVAGTVTITYSNGYSYTSKSIAPGGSLLVYQPNESGLPAGFNGGATVVSNGPKIVGLINIQGATTSDQFFSTNAFGSN